MAIRRIACYLYLVAALAFVALKWKTFPHALHLVQRGMTDGYMVLVRLSLVLVGVFVAISVLRRRQPRRNVAQAAGGGIQYRSTSLKEMLRQLPTIVRKAFGLRPIWASILSMFMISIPVFLVSMAHAGGLKTFGLDEWILVAVMELPMAIVACVVLVDVWSHRGGNR